MLNLIHMVLEPEDVEANVFGSDLFQLLRVQILMMLKS